MGNLLQNLISNPVTQHDKFTKAEKGHTNLFQLKILSKQRKPSYFIHCVLTSNTLRVKTHTQLKKFLTGVQDKTLFCRTFSLNNEA